MISEQTTRNEISKWLIKVQRILSDTNKMMQNDLKMLSSQIETGFTKSNTFEKLRKKYETITLDVTFIEKIHILRSRSKDYDIEKWNKLTDTVSEFEDLFNKIQSYREHNTRGQSVDFDLMQSSATCSDTLKLKEFTDAIAELDILITSRQATSLEQHNSRVESSAENREEKPVTVGIAKKIDELKKENRESVTENIEKEEVMKIEEYELIDELKKKYGWGDNLTETTQLLTRLETENSNLRGEIRCYKGQLLDAAEDVELSTKKLRLLHDELNEHLNTICELKVERDELKKQVVREMVETTKAKRTYEDAQVALEHFAKVYELKRKEIVELKQRLENANKVIALMAKQPPS